MQRFNALILSLLASCCTPASVEPDTTEEAAPISWNQEQLTVVIEALSKQCPLNAPVKITIGPLDDVWGITSWDAEAEVYVIAVDSKQPMHSFFDTLIHEWAHAMVWDASQRSGDDRHGPMWGVAWARCYRALISTYGSQPESEVGDPCFRSGGRVAIQFSEELTLEDPGHDRICTSGCTH